MNLIIKNATVLFIMRDFLKETWSFVGETIRIVVVSLLIILPIRYFIVQPFFVRGESMFPNFHNNDYLIVDELSYRFYDPKRGDVVVFRFPQDPSQYYIKRIIGLPGETVEVKEDKTIVYNRENPVGMILPEAYLTESTLGDMKIKLDENEYFVMGDNRDESSDSRRWGPLPKHLIIGRAWLRVWPFNTAQAFEAPNYR